MKKIILGLLGITLTVALVGATAYAVFSSTVRVQGLTVGTGNANLEISFEAGAENSWHSGAVDVSGTPNIDEWTQNLYPGMQDYGEVTLRNNSAADIDLNLGMQITGYNTSDWDNNDLKNQIEVRVGEYVSGQGLAGDIYQNWRSLEWWAETERSFGVVLEPDEPERIGFEFRVRSDAGNDIADKQIRSVEVTFTGTQAL